jgi:hypothetical protein
MVGPLQQRGLLGRRAAEDHRRAKAGDMLASFAIALSGWLGAKRRRGV